MDEHLLIQEIPGNHQKLIIKSVKSFVKDLKKISKNIVLRKKFPQQAQINLSSFNDISLKQKARSFLSSDKKITKGLEKENLRSDISGKISSKSFPKSLGKFSCNEFVTRLFGATFRACHTNLENNIQLLSFLKNLHKFVEHNIEGDLLWNYSMPPNLSRNLLNFQILKRINQDFLIFTGLD